MRNDSSRRKDRLFALQHLSTTFADCLHLRHDRWQSASTTKKTGPFCFHVFVFRISVNNGKNARRKQTERKKKLSEGPYNNNLYIHPESGRDIDDVGGGERNLEGEGEGEVDRDRDMDIL